MKRIQLLCIFGLLALIPVGNWQGEEKATKKVGLHFEARPSKLTFAQGEPVEFIFLLRNQTNKDIEVPHKLALYYDIVLDIVGPQGRPATWCGVIPSIIWETRRVRILRGKEQVVARITISCVVSDPLNRRWGYDLSRPGQYSVKARYQPAIPACSASLAEAHRKPKYCDLLQAEPVTLIVADDPKGPRREP